MTTIKITGHFNAQTTFADVEAGKSVRIYGNAHEKDYDRTFSVGDIVEYDSYNLRYLGTITQITEKTVTIKPQYSERNRRLKFPEFVWRNWDFDLEKTNKENFETSWAI